MEQGHNHDYHDCVPRSRRAPSAAEIEARLEQLEASAARLAKLRGFAAAALALPTRRNRALAAAEVVECLAGPRRWRELLVHADWAPMPPRGCS